MITRMFCMDTMLKCGPTNTGHRSNGNFVNLYYISPMTISGIPTTIISLCSVNQKQIQKYLYFIGMHYIHKISTLIKNYYSFLMQFPREEWVRKFKDWSLKLSILWRRPRWSVNRVVLLSYQSGGCMSFNKEHWSFRAMSNLK